MKQPAIILFDGVCNLCNGFVQFIIRRDPAGQFQFASLQSEAGQALLKAHGVPQDAMDTVVLIENGTVYTHSDVALQVAPRLQGAWGWLRIGYALPLGWRNAIYNWVARNRYRWFGKKDQCMVPTPELKARFLE